MTSLSRRRMASTLCIVPTAAALTLALLPAATASAGEPAQSAAPMFYTAAVAGDGTLLRGHHVVSSERIAAGEYVVTFDVDVTGCAYIATANDPFVIADVPQTAQVPGRPDAVGVEMKTLVTTHWDGAFSLDVRCASSQSQFAVVGADGTVARGPDVVSVDHPSTGNYLVTFRERVADCAFTATIGATGSTREPGTGLVFPRNRKGGPRTVWVETDSSSGHHQPTDLPFHLAVTCGSSAARPWGVIDDLGGLARGSGVAATEWVWDGQTRAVVETPGGNCVYTATIGSPWTDRPQDSGLVKVYSEPTSQVGQTKIMLRTENISGGQVSYPVHFVLVC